MATHYDHTARTHRAHIGDIELTVVSDGYLDANFEILRGIEREDAERLLQDSAKPIPPRLAVNSFLLRIGDRNVLIETGSGDSMGPTLGKVPENLQHLGVDPSDIDVVLLTHMHPDHSNGLTDQRGNPWFPNAELLIHEDEVAHWTDDGRMARANERQRRRYFEAARRQLGPYRSNLRTFREGEVVPGITAMPIPGHTPGHTAYIIASGGKSLMVWGDTVHMPDIQIPRPDVTLEFDSDGAASAAMRRRVLDMAASEKLMIAGMHVDFPGFAWISRTANGYSYDQENTL